MKTKLTFAEKRERALAKGRKAGLSGKTVPARPRRGAGDPKRRCYRQRRRKRYGGTASVCRSPGRSIETKAFAALLRLIGSKKRRLWALDRLEGILLTSQEKKAVKRAVKARP